MANVFKQITPATVSVADTAVPLSITPKQVIEVVIQAFKGNTGTICVGDSTVTSTTGIQLDAGEALVLSAPEVSGTPGTIDLSTIYVNSSNAGDLVNIAYTARE